MSGSGYPPEGAPTGGPGGDDEYRSVVFDESFVRAARIREYSARERMDDVGRAVATRHTMARVGRHRQALLLVLLMALAFGSAIYLGVRHPYRPLTPVPSGPLHIQLTPLTPQGPVPAALADPLFDADHVAGYRTGADGITLPAVRGTAHFTGGQVRLALTISKEYLIASSLDVTALTGGDVRGVRDLLSPGELQQFDRSLDRPADDGRHAATGWLVRFDPDRVVLADPDVKVQGTMAVTEDGADGLEVATDHTLVYTVRSADSDKRAPSLFTVRRQLRLYFDHDDLAAHQVELEQSAVEAGPLDCGSDPSAYFRPLLTGQVATSGVGTDPYDHRQSVAGVCGTLRTPPSPSPSPTLAPGAGRLRDGD